jgi:hypothetical protein
MRGSLTRVFVLAVLIGGHFPAVAAGQPVLTKEQMRQFLLTAKVIKSVDLPKGITRPVRLTLSDGTLTHDAAFASVNDRQGIMRYTSGKVERDFVDSHGYSIAAYGLAELLGLDDMMPVTVERKWDGRKGSLSWWVDDVMMDEGERMKKGLKPEDPDDWNRQMHRMRVFTQLVGDVDRNTGNVLISSGWKLWMIDFTRAFRRSPQLMAPGDLVHIDPDLLEKLRGLTREAVVEKTKPYIGPAEVAPLLKRRDVIVAHFDKLLAARGEDGRSY